MPVTRLIYASRPFGYDTAILSGILLDARRFNSDNDITGALIARADLYLQLLEGPDDTVRALFKRIARDDRHLDVQVLLTRTSKDRLFDGWAMRDDPAKSWMWTREQIADGALARAPDGEVEAVFERVRREISG